MVTQLIKSRRRKSCIELTFVCLPIIFLFLFLFFILLLLLFLLFLPYVLLFASLLVQLPSFQSYFFIFSLNYVFIVLLCYVFTTISSSSSSSLSLAENCRFAGGQTFLLVVFQFFFLTSVIRQFNSEPKIIVISVVSLAVFVFSLFVIVIASRHCYHHHHHHQAL